MEAIKTKYDRVLLGLGAAVSLVIGIMLLLKLVSGGSEFGAPPKAGKEEANFGTDKGGDVDKALTALDEKVERKLLSLPGGRSADLFVSTPVIKTADGRVIALLDETADMVRPPIANSWLYENGLDITRDDIAMLDSDGDGYTNAEEFEGKSNPRNRTSVPPFYTKLVYKECVKEPLSLRFAIYNPSNGEIQLSRTEPKPTRSAFLRAGDVFSVDSRFKVAKVEMRDDTQGGVTRQVAYLIIEDSLAKNAPPLEIKLGDTVERPKLSARVVDELSGKEFVLAEGQEFELPKMPGTKVLVAKVTEEEVTISFIMPGKPGRQEHVLKIK